MYRVEQFSLSNYGKIQCLNNIKCSNINVILGENSTGKTFLLKALYVAIKSQEDYLRGDDTNSLGDILAEKIKWTFQVERLGDLVTKNAKEPLEFSMTANKSKMEFRFTKDANRKIVKLSGGVSKEGNSIFIPAKEVLSLYSIILQSREINKVFGFDDTYYDLAKALRISPSRGKNYSTFAYARKKVKSIIDGSIDYDESSGKWFYKNSNRQKFSIGATSEGIKKISILDRLLANGYLTKESVVLIDEIEAALHPQAICEFLDMIYDISKKMGIQFFITTHSYFVIKKLYLLAMREQGMVNCISLENIGNNFNCDLFDGMPPNSIINTSVNLYIQEIDEVL